MPIFSRRSATPRRSPPSVLRCAPSCRGGVSSLLRLAQPAPPGLTAALRSGFAPLYDGAPDFAPSQWLVGR